MHLGFRNNSRLCQSCAAGYSRTSRSSCVPCNTSKDDGSNVIILVFAVLGICILFFVLNLLRMRSFQKFNADRRRKALHSTIKRIILSHFQMVSIVLGLSVPWPKLLESVLNTVSSLVSFSEGINRFECLYQGIDHSDFYNGVLVFTAVFPLLSTGFLALYWFGLVQCFGPLKCGSRIQSGPDPKTNETTTEAITTTTRLTIITVTYTNTDAFISSTVLLCFFLVPSIVAIGTTFLRCYDVGGQLFVYIDLEKECYQGNHLFFALLVAWPMILLYGALMPGFVMLRLRRAGAVRSTDPHLMLRWGMLHSGYRPSKYWWEMVVLLRKYSIIMLVTFNSKGAYQLHLALGIIIVVLHFHDSQRPFGHRHVDPTNAVLHRYEMGSLLILLVMLWCAGFFLLELCHTEHGWCDFMAVVVVVSNFLLVGVLLVMYVKEWCKRKDVAKTLYRMIVKKKIKNVLASQSVGGRKKTKLPTHPAAMAQKKRRLSSRELMIEMSSQQLQTNTPAMKEAEGGEGGELEGKVKYGEGREGGGEVTVTLGVNPMHATRGKATKQRIKRLSKVMKARQYESGGGGGDDAINVDGEDGKMTIALDVEAVVTMHVDEETGRRYSHNAATGQTQWFSEDDEKDGATHEEPGDRQQERRILYRKIAGDDNAVFFQNVETGETVWTMPKNGDLVP
jgi:hypothetical protein